jgi:hypothetical protein
MEPMVQDLQAWYDSLPLMLHLGQTGQDLMPIEAKRSIFHIHVLYLGANMLIYRQIALQRLQSQGMDPEHNSLLDLHEGKVLQHGERALLAATHSNRILKLSLEKCIMPKRCWLVM